MLNMIERVKNDYFMFEKLIMLTSKQNIYEKANEIQTKKQIVSDVEQLSFSEEDVYMLYPVEGLLDYIYLVRHEKEISTAEAIQYIERTLREENV